MKVNTRVRYAIRLMIDLMENSVQNRPVQIKDVARRQGISKRYLSQIVLPLRNARLIRSISGRYGGYSLARPPSEIRIGEIFEVMNGPITLLDCIEGEELCMASEYCRCREMWGDVNRKIKETLYSYTLESLSEEKRKNRIDAESPRSNVDFPNLCSSNP